MSESETIEALRKYILDLQTEVKHLTNELRLTREENEEAVRKYFDIYYNLDGKVKERTTELERANRELKKEIAEREKTELEKIELEGKIRQTQKMEAIGTLAGGIAHDFNNILVAIVGYTEVSRDALPSESPLRKDLGQVLDAARRARELVKHILTFSRQGAQEMKPLQIHLVVKEALKLLRATIPTNIDMRAHIDSTSTIKGDPTQIHQIIVNLCTNAAHAMEEKGGEMEVNVSNVYLGEDELRNDKDLNVGPYTMLAVRDSGPGMDPYIVRRIFDPYFTTKDFGKGSGMGLSVVHGIVKSHGGMIAVESDPGKGSTFKVFFPRIERSLIFEESEADVLPTGTESILFVDDEWTGADLGKRLLEELGYKVTARTSSVEALEAFRSQADKFDLVITDQTMPNMVGTELAQEILKIRPDIPVILCTGYSAQINEEKVKALGLKALAMKPLFRRELAEKVRMVLDDDQP